MTLPVDVQLAYQLDEIIQDYRKNTDISERDIILVAQWLAIKVTYPPDLSNADVAHFNDKTERLFMRMVNRTNGT